MIRSRGRSSRRSWQRSGCSRRPGSILYSFVETMGVPEGLLSHKYYFPTYNNTWGPLNSQIRFGNLDAAATTIRVTIGGVVEWQDVVPGLEERRLYFDVSGGPVIIESLDETQGHCGGHPVAVQTGRISCTVFLRRWGFLQSSCRIPTTFRPTTTPGGP